MMMNMQASMSRIRIFQGRCMQNARSLPRQISAMAQCTNLPRTVPFRNSNILEKCVLRAEKQCLNSRMLHFAPQNYSQKCHVKTLQRGLFQNLYSGQLLVPLSSCQTLRYFRSSRDDEHLETPKEGTQQPGAYEESSFSRSRKSAWNVRLANENTYLSWCRNTYIATLLAYTSKISLEIPVIQPVTAGFIGLALLNLTIGTSIFVFNVVYLRHEMQLSLLGLMAFIFGAVAHLLLYMGAITTYTDELEGGDSGEDYV